MHLRRWALLQFVAEENWVTELQFQTVGCRVLRGLGEAFGGVECGRSSMATVVGAAAQTVVGVRQSERLATQQPSCHLRSASHIDSTPTCRSCVGFCITLGCIVLSAYCTQGYTNCEGLA